MDQNYIFLWKQLKNSTDNLQKANAQIRLYLYLLLLANSEVWWRLRCRDEAALLERMYDVKDACAMLGTLGDAFSTAFSDQEQINFYQTLLNLLNQCRYERNRLIHEDTMKISDDATNQRIAQIDTLLQNIAEHCIRGGYFPPLDPHWLPMVPVSRHENSITCMICKRQFDPVLDMIYYTWTSEDFPEDTPEFMYNDQRSASHLTEGRLYFYRPRQEGSLGSTFQITCAYPFVQIKFDPNSKTFTRLWLFDSVSVRANGSCRGVDLMAIGQHQGNLGYIPEISKTQTSSENPYLAVPGPGEPIRNHYVQNHCAWRDTKSAQKAIKTIYNALRDGTPLVYLYGRGGIGKTATVQHMMMEKYCRSYSGKDTNTDTNTDTSTDKNKNTSKNPIYDYLIFLSAKKKAWNPTSGLTSIEYKDATQFFHDHASLHAALCNLFPLNAGESLPESSRYADKKILLVLDDFESIEQSEQEKILSYLQEHFMTGRGKHHQIIITCRTAPAEGEALNVHLQEMNWWDTASFAQFCAEQIDSTRDITYRQALGTASNAQDLTREQSENRTLLQKLTQGTPLVTRILVFNTPDAKFEQYKSGLSDNLLNYLMKDTYNYLETSERKQVAALCTFLTRDTESPEPCPIARLEYVWKQQDGSDADALRKILSLLQKYGILYLEPWKDPPKTFRFSSQSVRKHIQSAYLSCKAMSEIPGAGSDPSILAPNIQALAEWLAERPNSTIQDALIYQFQRRLKSCYALDNQLDYYHSTLHGINDMPCLENKTSAILIEELITLYHCISDIDEKYQRALLQQLLQVYYDRPCVTAADLGKIISHITSDRTVSPSTIYATEITRLCLSASHDSNVLDDFQGAINQLFQAIQDSTRRKQYTFDDPRNILLIAWDTMLLIQDLFYYNIAIPPYLADGLYRLMAPCISPLSGRSSTDRSHFQDQLQRTIQILQKDQSENSDTIAALNNFERIISVPSFCDSKQPPLFFGTSNSTV